MLNKKIIFCASNKDMVDIWPHPKPASRVIPDEYKKLKRFENNNFHNPTVKTCIPFLDSLTMGYIISFDQWQKTTGKNAGKFINKWLIKTPPGYSCLFVKPMNRIESRFEIIPGVVDTDTFINIINFPFILHKRNEQFLIKKGEPMVQVIPFKRESWKMWSGFYFEKAHNKVVSMLRSEWVDRYKKMFWAKKNFK